MPFAVTLLKVYVHPRTRKRISAKKAALYNKRAKKKIRPYGYIQVKHTLGDLKGLTSEQKERRKREAGRIVYTSKLTTIHTVLPLSTFSDRHLRLTLGRRGVFKKLFEDFHKKGTLHRRGSIRITLGGVVEGRRVKQVTHLAFSRRHWLSNFSTEEYAYEAFKDWMIATILANLRRRDIRLSNAKESAGRIGSIRQKRETAIKLLEVEDDPKLIPGLEEQVRWSGRAIKKQKKSVQMKKAFIKIEKLV